jgi:hypothetical protein
MELSFAMFEIGASWPTLMRGREGWSFRFRRRLRLGGSCGQWRKRIGKVCLGDLLERFVDSDGLGWPSRMHDEQDSSGSAATRIAAIAFADGDNSFIIGVDGRPGMLFQFTHSVPSVVRRFPWEEKNSHGPQSVWQRQIGAHVML